MAPSDDGHTPVSNEPEQDGTGQEQEQTREPSEGGEAPQAPAAYGAEGDAGAIEQVEGYQPPAPAKVAQLHAAIDDGLRDIGEASFGPSGPRPESVIGVDDRVQIGTTDVYAWRVHCSLRMTAGDGSQWIGTGWFCGPRTIITAGHCVFIRNSNVPNRDGWIRSVIVMPGRNGSTLPYGSVTVGQGGLRSVLGWTRDGNHEFDYGAIILPTNLGSQTGWLGYGTYTDATLTSSTGNISGYPGDKPGGTQWYHARRITSVSANKVYYDIDTAGGQSGSAVYRIVNGARYAVGIHAYGGSTSNSGARINSGVFANLSTWSS